MTSRLDTVAPGVVELLAGAKPATLRRIAGKLAKLVVAHAELNDPAIQEALTALRDGQFGDIAVRTAVKQLVESLDQQYWDLQDRANEGHVSEGDYLAAFARARAVSVLDFALDIDPYLAASEGAYEALTALDDLEVIHKLIAVETAH